MINLYSVSMGNCMAVGSPSMWASKHSHTHCHKNAWQLLMGAQDGTLFVNV